MSRKLSRDFRIKFGAASLHLQSNCDDAVQRAVQSSQHAAALTDLLANGGELTGAEKDELASLVLATTVGWMPIDRSTIMAALDAVAKRCRRSKQEWVNNSLNIFTQGELDLWKARGAAGINSTLSEIIARVMQLGGKLLCEYSKKVLCAVWLHFRGDGCSMGGGGREIAYKMFKERYNKLMRNFEPAFLMDTLPVDMADLRTSHPLVYDKAYARNPPVPMPDADLAEIMMLDAMMSCRGGSVLPDTQIRQPPQLQQHALMQLPSPQLQQQLQQLQQLLMSHSTAAAPQECELFYPQQGRGRPMRSLSDGQLAAEIRRAASIYAEPAGGVGTPHKGVQNVDAVSEGGTPNHGALAERRDITGSAKKEETGVIDDIDKVAAAMLKRKSDCAENVDSESNSDDDRPVMKKPAAASHKKRASHKKKLSPAPKKDPPKKFVALAVEDVWKTKPKMSMERTRGQVMCRTGKVGRGSTHAIPFKGNGGEKGALAKAEKWLANACREYMRAGHTM